MLHSLNDEVVVVKIKMEKINKTQRRYRRSQSNKVHMLLVPFCLHYTHVS